MLKKIASFIDSQKKYIESVEITPIGYFLSIVSMIGIRVLIENFSNPEQTGLFTHWMTFVGYILFYIAILFTLPIFISFFTKKKPLDILKYSLFSSPLILLPPLFDLLLSGGKGFCMGYNGAHHWYLLRDFFTFFGPIQSCGISIGIRIEIVILMLGIFAFIFSETKKFWKGILAALVGYVVVFTHLSLPGILMTLDLRTFDFNSIERYFTSIFSGSLLSSAHTFLVFNITPIARYYEYLALFTGRITWLLSLVGIVYIFWRSYGEKTKAVLMNMRPARIVLNILFVAVGGHLAYLIGLVPHSFSATDYFGFFIFCLVLAVNFVLAVLINDMYDTHVDKHTNTNRPLVSQVLTQQDMKNAAVIAGIFALLGSLLFNYHVFVLMVLFQAIYYIYSAPPLRFRRYFPVGSMLVALTSCVAMLSGYFLVAENQVFAAFPIKLLAIFFLFIFSVVHAKDLKDTSGDDADNITTLATLIGTKKARITIGIVALAWIFALILFALTHYVVWGYVLMVIFACAVAGLIFTKKGEAGGFALLYCLMLSFLVFVR
jgi:4-hydroxybenzoate polyprenyltransferase